MFTRPGAGTQLRSLPTLRLGSSSCIAVLQDGLEDHFKSKAGKSFKTNYLELWDKVMRECQSADLLFDNYLLDKVSYLVIALSW